MERFGTTATSGNSYVIDAELQMQLETEKHRWREVLDRILHTIKLCAEQNLALRGHRETINGPDNPGNFLAILKYLSRYDAVSAQHLDYAVSNPRSVSYLSHDTQNEFIEILGNAVREQIIKDIKEAKYYSIMFDSTPDLAHREQLSQIIRYVCIEGKNVSIKESFIDFFEIHQKNAESLAREITDKLERDGLRLDDCRGQSYDNAAVMAGHKTGVQARIIKKNPLAIFVPCDNHSLNLVGVHAAHVDPLMVTFFGTIERIFSYFSSSTHRWEILKEHADLAVKKECETRWSSRNDAVEAVSTQLNSIVDALEQLRDSPNENADTRGDAGSVLHNVLNFNFLVLLPFWQNILQSINRIQIRLQDPTINFKTTADDLNGLKSIFESKSEELRSTALAKGKMRGMGY